MKNNLYAYGIMSRTYDNSHIYMGDIDNDLSLKEVTTICEGIIKHFNLSDMYIIKSTHGYNIYSLDKLPLKMVYLINNCTKEVDRQFNSIAFHQRHFYVLRTMPKEDKNYVKTVVSWKPNIFIKSNAHRIYFNNYFGWENSHKVYNNEFYDTHERIWFIQFRNKKHGWEIVDNGQDN